MAVGPTARLLSSFSVIIISDVTKPAGTCDTNGDALSTAAVPSSSVVSFQSLNHFGLKAITWSSYQTTSHGSRSSTVPGMLVSGSQSPRWKVNPQVNVFTFLCRIDLTLWERPVQILWNFICRFEWTASQDYDSKNSNEILNQKSRQMANVESQSLKR